LKNPHFGLVPEVPGRVAACVGERIIETRPHQGRWCYGKTPMDTFRDSIDLAKEKMIAAE